MKTISLKIEESIFLETEKIISETKKARNRYINEAIEYYNTIQRKIALKQKLKNESLLIKEDSMAVLYELEKLDD